MRCDGSNRVTVRCHDGRLVRGIPVAEAATWTGHDPRNTILDPGKEPTPR